jgi:hypothetical protein
MICSVSMEDLIPLIPGAQQLFDWFGYWPSFHDAEVLSIELNRAGPSKVQVHTFAMTDQVDAKGFYVCDKHCIVTFVLRDLIAVQLAHFNDQNALSDLDFYRENDEFVLDFCGSHGVEGTIRAKQVSIDTRPGIPSDSVYQTSG